ncbi:MAG: EamA family transporter [Actinomycetota bacterium]|jgi:drug/metabolite transporter (DMT)-like permease|nr:EamA family transporter [Actinomycetota bacterium]
MGYFLGLLSALFYATGAIFYRVGHRSRPNDDGQLVSNSINAIVLGVCLLFVTWTSWHLAGFLALIGGGLFGTVFGRFGQLRGIRLVGPTRASTFSAATPIPTAIAGWIFLGENVTPIEMLGGAITIFGVVQIIRSRSSAWGNEPVPRRYYVIALGAPLWFGIAVFLRKWGIERMPGAVIGAFVGSAAGVIAMLLWSAARRQMGSHVRRAIAQPPWAFCAAGCTSAAALLTQFWALARIEAWVVGILAGTVTIWTPILSRVFLKQDEAISKRLIGNIGIVFLGVVVIAAS